LLGEVAAELLTAFFASGAGAGAAVDAAVSAALSFARGASCCATFMAGTEMGAAIFSS